MDASPLRLRHAGLDLLTQLRLVGGLERVVLRLRDIHGQMPQGPALVQLEAQVMLRQALVRAVAEGHLHQALDLAGLFLGKARGFHQRIAF